MVKRYARVAVTIDGKSYNPGDIIPDYVRDVATANKKTSTEAEFKARIPTATPQDDLEDEEEDIGEMVQTPDGPVPEKSNTSEEMKKIGRAYAAGTAADVDKGSRVAKAPMEYKVESEEIPGNTGEATPVEETTIPGENVSAGDVPHETSNEEAPTGADAPTPLNTAEAPVPVKPQNRKPYVPRSLRQK